MTAKTEARMTGLFDQAVQTFGDAMKQGVKMQEEMARWWTDAFDQASPMQQWQKRSRAMLNQALPQAQKNTEEFMRIMEQNYRRSMELLKKTFNMEDTDTAAELQEKFQQVWEESLDVLRDNAQAMAQTNMKIMEMWAEIMRRNMNGSEHAAH